MIDIVPVAVEEDLVRVRQKVRQWAATYALSTLKTVKMQTAASELARNILVYAGTGTVFFSAIDGPRREFQIIFEDQGPGIADIEQALQDGYTTGSGMGIGLPGTKRLVDHFEIVSAPGQGTRVIIAMRI
ncbi:anti-sigma regulatory factor [Heliophilum fasciatum]|uniref:Serine/threonine-protein kinase RsbT n=1 Tax=Heliophilum fasciatum TaxID=35700 RepID=A0A4R2RZC1_9FIRM|nr:anti-sigma regulatory factor [Heliophilum fasciatum]MCW2276735.1 serine/threonine-protein kinase RsbT [Heliophilum fasciatum]TCP68884.1 serine/threonine-protein kinase RsbT [Heliophilum fasciatum]